MIVAMLLAAAGATPLDPVASVETCLTAVGPHSLDEPRLAANGWAEVPIKNIDKAPGGAAANRMFHKDGQGVIVVNVGDKNIYHCRWAVAADRAEAARLNLTLAAHYGGKTTAMTPTSFMFDVNGRDIIAISDFKPADKGTLFEVHTMAFDPKELRKETKK